MKTRSNGQRFHRMFLTVSAIISGALLHTEAQPTIRTQPADQFVDAGKSAAFAVVSSNAPPLAYQWFFNGAELTGATNRTLTLSSAQPSLNGNYIVTISDAFGSVTSRVAQLKVFMEAPHGFSRILLQPDGSAELGLAGETTAKFQQYFDLHPLEASSNLTDWFPLTTLVRTNASTDALNFVDTAARDSAHRFYRTPTNRFITPLPRPTGRHPVGTFSRLLTDPSRTNTTRRTNHQFMITVWYPAVARSGQVPAPYVDKAVALNTVYYEPFTDRVPSFVSHSFTNAPLSIQPAPFPVLLYSCGGYSHRRDNTELTEELASGGYVVVGMDHRDSTLSVFPDGKVVTGSLDQSSNSAMEKQLDDRVLDARFVLDQLTSWNTADPFFIGRLDLGRIGAFGASYGGAMATELARVDSRCKASVNMDGILWKTNLLSQPLSTPFMLLRSILPDSSAPGGNTMAIYNALTTNAYVVRVSNATHANFGYRGLIWDPVTFATEFSHLPPSQQTPGLRVCQITRAYLRSFFSKFLLGEDDHLLDGPSADYPEVSEFLRK